MSPVANESESYLRFAKSLFSGSQRDSGPILVTHDIALELFMYVHMMRIPCGSESMSARIGILRDCFSIRKKRRLATSGWPLPVTICREMRE